MHFLALLQKFQCLGATCADNCCNSWAVKIDAPTYQKWQNEAPELLSLASNREGVGHVIAMTGANGCCPKLEQGLCGIHRDRGETFLTDACSLYPRITRAIGNTTVQTATLSCPEIARLALFDETPFEWEDAQTNRVPSSLKNYLPEGMNEQAARQYIEGIIRVAGSGTLPSADLLADMLAFAHAHNAAPLKDWPTLAAPSLPQPEQHPHDALYLLILLTTLVQSSGITPSIRLTQLVRIIEQVLQVKVKWSEATVDMGLDFPRRREELHTFWNESCAEYLDPLLLRVIQTQFSATLYPFAGLGNTAIERATWLTVTFATMRLSLMCVCKFMGGLPTEEEAIQAIQPLARIFDHVGNFDLVRPILEETGWLNLPRGLGILYL